MSMPLVRVHGVDDVTVSLTADFNKPLIVPAGSKSTAGQGQVRCCPVPFFGVSNADLPRIAIDPGTKEMEISTEVDESMIQTKSTQQYSAAISGILLDDATQVHPAALWKIQSTV